MDILGHKPQDGEMVDVVVIEDNLDDSEITQFALLQTGENVRLKHFRTGPEALNFILAKDNVHDEIKFVILDIDLPNMSGLEVLRRLRAEKRTNKLPVIIVSGSKDPELVEVAYHLGANSYVVKPTGFDGYVKKVGSLANYWFSVNQIAPITWTRIVTEH